MKAQDLMNAFESLDSELLYAARADQPMKRRSFSKLPIAAAIVLLLIMTAVLYGIFIAPASIVYLDSRESVTITLNSRGNLLSADGYPQLDGKSAEYAVAYITRDMLDNGLIDDRENTLIIATQKLSEKTQDILSKTVHEVFTESRLHGATISLSCSENGAKASVIRLLSDIVDTFTAENLSELSANDLNLLVHEYDVSGGLSLSGDPSEGMYIGKAAAKARAMKLTKLSGGEIEVTYSVYHRRMVYLVTIIKADRAEAYFINAVDGTVENVVKTTAEQIQKTIGAEVKESNQSTPQTNRSTPQTAADDPQAAETIEQTLPMTATEITRALPAIPQESAAAIENNPLPTTVSTSPPTTSTQPPTVTSPTQPQADAQPEEIQMTSLSMKIPYSDQMNLFDMTLDEGDDDSFGEKIPFTLLNGYNSRLNWRDINDMKKSEINAMGKQDRYIALYSSYADFIHDSFADLGNESALGEHLNWLITDNGINEDFFRENALLAVTYHDYSVYPGENDSICTIRVQGDTALVNLLRKNTKGTEIETDYYKAVMWAVVKKTDVKNIMKFQLFVTKQK